MEKSIFANLVVHPEAFSYQDKVQIQEEKMRAPHSALLQLLDLLSDKACNIQQWETKSLPKVLLYVPSRERVGQMLDRVTLKDNTATATAPTSVPTPSATPTQPVSTNEAVDILKEINDYQEVSFKTAPKSVILDKFLETGACRGVESSSTENVSVADLGKKSIQPNETIETETLALIFEKQGKFEKAIDIYKKLIVKYPEKSSTFATRIEELNNKIENK